MTFAMTAQKKVELKKMAKDSGISYEALVDSEKMSALYAEGGIEALETAGYHCTRSTHPDHQHLYQK